ncbi:MAG: DUF4910 domain-containing protein [Ignavibacteriales bacterium]|nr:DUF4910 domain-containing protein [Ignavibacteriales bacterium]
MADAELSIVEPTPEKLVSFREIPMSLMTYSNHGDVKAEVIWVGAGTHDSDYTGKKVKGKFVLTTGYGGDVHRLAVLKYGAKAVVRFIDEKRSQENPDMIHYSGLWPKADELKKTTFGFNISYQHGQKIKNLLESGQKVILHGWVKGKGLHPYFMDVVIAHIRGKEFPDQELLFSAHLDHPKECANDNASGSAAILDIAHTLKSLIDSNKLPQPRRSFRFLWVPEWNGTMAYIDAHPELSGPAEGGKILASVNLDMVGENLELLHSKMYIVQTPRSVPSCLNDVIANMASMVDKMNIRTPNGSRSQFNYRVVPYWGGSDHMMFLDRKIPSVMISHSDYTHHTTYDSPDKVDPVELERSEMIATSALWYLANLNREGGIDLIELMKANAYQNLGEMVRVTKNHINSAPIKTLPMAWAEADNMLNYAFYEEIEAANSILNFNDDSEIRDILNQIRPHFGKRFEHLFGFTRKYTEDRGHSSDFPPPLSEKADERIPIRTTRGPLDFRIPESKLPANEATWYESKDFPLNEKQRFEFVNLIDGKRKFWEVRNLFLSEFPGIPESITTRYLNDLVKVGVIKWQETIKK